MIPEILGLPPNTICCFWAKRKPGSSYPTMLPLSGSPNSLQKQRRYGKWPRRLCDWLWHSSATVPCLIKGRKVIWLQPRKQRLPVQAALLQFSQGKNFRDIFQEHITPRESVDTWNQKNLNSNSGHTELCDLRGYASAVTYIRTLTNWDC